MLGLSRTLSSSPAQWIADCRAGERLGLKPLSADLGGCDAFVDAALALQATSSVPVGISVALPTRSPLQSAYAGASLARLAPGRLTLGFAAGSRFVNELGHGVPFDHPITRLTEFAACVTAVLRAEKGAPVELAGRHHRVRGVGAGLDATALPLVIGAHGPAAARLAGEVADGIIVHLMTPAAVVRERVGLARAARPQLDAPFSVGVGRTTSVADDEEQALAEARAETAAFLSLPHFRPRLATVADGDVVAAFDAAIEAGDGRAAMAALADEVVRQFVTVTTPARFHDDLRALEPADTITPVPVGTFWRMPPGRFEPGPQASAAALRRLRAALLPTAGA